MDVDVQPALRVLSVSKNQLASLVPDPDAYLSALKEYLERSPEDRRRAVSLAVDLSKSFVAVAMAALAAMIAFFQKDLGSVFVSPSVRSTLFALVALLLIASIYFGAIATSNAWKRGEGRIGVGEPAWSTNATGVKGPLNLQALFGMVALALFAGLVIESGMASSRPLHGLSIDLGGTVASVSGALSVSGEWDNLALTDDHGRSISLPSATSKSPSPFRISPLP